MGLLKGSRQQQTTAYKIEEKTSTAIQSSTKLKHLVIKDDREIIYRYNKFVWGFCFGKMQFQALVMAVKAWCILISCLSANYVMAKMKERLVFPTE